MNAHTADSKRGADTANVANGPASVETLHEQRPTGSAVERFETVFIDSAVDRLSERLESLPDCVRDIVFLSPVHDGLTEIVAYLAKHGPVHGVHLLALCTQGEMMLGNQLYAVKEVQSHIQQWLAEEK